ncbi:MAG TPA: hypothetical protein VN903_21860 [Polyangia bacterium]|nr:hypothetical protein [Polyangia bacterium]
MQQADAEEFMNTGESAMARPAYKRKVKNYLLDVGLQLRYTATIVVIAIVLTAILGHRIYQATQDTSKVILWTGLVDQGTAKELESQFAQSDRTVLLGIIGFGVILVLSISGVGILLTHKVAGPLYKISSFFGRIRDNRLGPAPAKLRKGDELQDFYSSFREMHQAVRGRVEDDVRVLEGALAAIEAAPESKAAGIQRALEDLRKLQKRKEDSLEAPPIDRMTTSSNS